VLAPVDLHAQGPRVSRLLLGAWRLAQSRLDNAGIRNLVAAAIDVGITTIDHADIYGDYACERLFGAALIDAPDLKRQVQIVTKCGIKLRSQLRPEHRVKHYDTSRAHIIASAENSLRFLGVERLDLLLLHRPDPFMDADATAAALDELVASGKVAHIGVSNFAPSQMDLLGSRLRAPLTTNQIELSVLQLAPFTDGTLDACQLRRMAPMAWSPLGGGRLFAEGDAHARRLRDTLYRIGQKKNGASIEQMAYAWLLAHPARIVPVLGTSKIERLREAARAIDLDLDRQDWFEIWQAAAGNEVP